MKCILCEEKISKGDQEEAQFSIKGKPAHQECYENETSGGYTSTCFEFNPDGEINKTEFDENFVYYSDSDNYDSLPVPVKKQIYVHSDGWRGYTDWKLLPGYIEVGDGWVTGYPDETTSRKLELGEIFQKLQDKEITPPCKVFWIFGVTSNVFSTASTVAIEKGNKPLFKAWLEEINGGLEDFQSKFE